MSPKNDDLKSNFCCRHRRHRRRRRRRHRRRRHRRRIQTFSNLKTCIIKLDIFIVCIFHVMLCYPIQNFVFLFLLFFLSSFYLSSLFREIKKLRFMSKKTPANQDLISKFKNYGDTSLVRISRNLRNW